MSQLLHARQKVLGALATISELEEIDFPYTDSKEALRVIEDKFRELHRTLGLLTERSDPKTVRTVCRRVTESLFQYLPILGFLVRSTDVQGPLEFHGPFLRLTKRLLGSDARLIVSSDWDFSPYTIIFPDLFKGNKFVMVALPTSEASNALITPLAAHELGHNVWAKENLGEAFGKEIADVLVRQIKGPRWTEFSKEFGLDDREQVTDLVGYQIWENAWIWALAQCEELFCDFVGVVLFGSSYLLAFDYLVSPGLPGGRVERYPSMKNRVVAMTDAAKIRSIHVPEDFVSRFEDEEGSDKSSSVSLLLSISDEAALILKNQLLDAVVNIVGIAGLGVSSGRSIDSTVEAFKNMVPVSGAASIDAIVNGAWEFKTSFPTYWEREYPFLKDDVPRQTQFLNELVLKSLEVFEIEQIQSGTGR